MPNVLYTIGENKTYCHTPLNFLGCRKGFWGNPSCINPCVCNQLNTIDCDQNNGTCYCRTGWEGHDCNMDVNECRKPNVCPWNFDCVNTVGSYTCKCKPGFQLKQGKCISCKSLNLFLLMNCC